MASHSHPNNLINLGIFICVPLWILYSLATQKMEGHYLLDLYRLLFPILFFSLIAVPLADIGALRMYLGSGSGHPKQQLFYLLLIAR
jgi:hypothetical protein